MTLQLRPILRFDACVDGHVWTATRMNSLLAAFGALAGLVVGGLISGIATWLSQHDQGNRQVIPAHCRLRGCWVLAREPNRTFARRGMPIADSDDAVQAF